VIITLNNCGRYFEHVQKNMSKITVALQHHFLPILPPVPGLPSELLDGC